MSFRFLKVCTSADSRREELGEKRVREDPKREGLRGGASCHLSDGLWSFAEVRDIRRKMKRHVKGVLRERGSYFLRLPAVPGASCPGRAVQTHNTLV